LLLVKEELFLYRREEIIARYSAQVALHFELHSTIPAHQAEAALLPVPLSVTCRCLYRKTAGKQLENYSKQFLHPK
jgi:hypothetical protein